MRRRSLAAAALLVSSMAVAFPVMSSPADAAIPDKALFAATAFEYARESGKQVEITSLTTPTTKAFARPDGQTLVQVAAGPVRMHRGTEWVDFDMTLQRRADGTIAPKVHAYDLVLSGAAGTGDHVLASVALGGERQGLNWRGRLPEPRLDGAKATYADVTPGVDLVVEARPGGFEQFLIVKNRGAAARIAALRLGVHAPNGRFSAEKMAWTDARGQVLAHLPEPEMWDAQPLNEAGEHPRRARVDIRDRVVTPDLGWLTDPATVYPVTIDPGLETYIQAGFDEFVQNTINISDNQSKTELRAGYSDSSDCLAITSAGCRARSYLRFDGWGPFAGVKLTSATLYLWEFHAWSCNDWYWRASRTSWVDGGVQWGSEPGIEEHGPWSTQTRGYSSSCASGDDGWVAADVTNLLDDVINTGGSSLSLVVKVDGDTSNSSWSPLSHNSWKKFSSAETVTPPVIWFTYNHLPTMSEVKLGGDSTCGTGENRLYVPIIPDSATISARVNDADGANNHVRIEAELAPVTGGGSTQTQQSLNGPPGSVRDVTFTGLDTSKIYQYRVRGQDVRTDGVVMDSSAWSNWCEFAFDDGTLDPPIIEGLTQQFDGETLYYDMPYGEPVRFTLKADPADIGRVTGFRFGFDTGVTGNPDNPVVLAGPDGSATVSLTNWTIDGGVPSGSVPNIVVTALGITGYNNSESKLESIFNLYNFDLVQHDTTGDLSGDGKADLAGVQVTTANHDLLYVRHGNQDGTLGEAVNLRTVTDYASVQRAYVQGDFNGDGFTDLVAVVSHVGDSDKLDIISWQSDGNALSGADVEWLSPAGWPFTRTKPIVADVDADGDDDLVLALGNAAGTSYELKVFSATGTAEIAFAAPANGLASAATGNIANLKLVAGNFDGTGGDDLGAFRRGTGCQTDLYFHHNPSGTGYSAATSATWQSSGWCWQDSTFTAGDFDSTTNRTGIVASAFNQASPACHSDIYTFTSPYTAFATQHHTTRFCATRTEPLLRDIAGDARADLVLVHQDATAYQQHLWTMTTNGAAGGPDTFADPVLTEQGRIGPLGTNPDSTGNLSIGATATSSTACNSGEGPGDAINGTTTDAWDRWCSWVASPWLQVDLGRVQTVSSVVLRHGGAADYSTLNTRDFSLAVSANGSTWTNVATITGNTASVTRHTFAATQARYVKLSITTPTQNGSAYARIFEFEVYAGAPPANLASGKATSSSTTCGVNEGGDKAVNSSITGGLYDKWCSLTAPRWLQIDLGAVQNIADIVIWHSSAGGESFSWNTKDYNLLVSTDGSTWTTFASVTGNIIAGTRDSRALQAARYVKLEVVTPTQDGNAATRIYEVEVFPAA